ncbi:hypothetical protein D9M68_910030 [compost metagenome]
MSIDSTAGARPLISEKFATLPMSIGWPAPFSTEYCAASPGVCEYLTAAGLSRPNTMLGSDGVSPLPSVLPARACSVKSCVTRHLPSRSRKSLVDLAALR